MLSNFKSMLLSGSERSVKAKVNIIASFFNKGLAILISLLLVPITINYLNIEQYGIWLTLSSIVSWIAYFDIGLGHGFRNKFAEAQANCDIELARKYVSTAFGTLAIIFGVVLLIAELINPLLDWAALLKVDAPNCLLIDVVSLLLIGVGTNFVLNITTIMLSADQKPALSAMISTLGQGVALIVIYVLTLTTESNMRLIAIALSWTPCVITLSASLFFFKGNYKQYAPSIKYIDISLVKDILGLGGKFFVIQISMLVIFQVVNLIISRVLGPTAVTQYNIAYKYFSITQMAFNIVLSPFWSAYTEAYVSKDFSWMKSVHVKLSKLWRWLLLINAVFLIVSPIAYKIWLHGSVDISWFLSIAMCIYMSILSYSNMYMVLLNGIGKVTVQMIIYIACALVAIPCSHYLCSAWGLPGLVLFLSSVYLIQGMFAKYQLKLILSNNVSGIWNI